MVSNEEFLKVIFGEEWEKAHVTSFVDDPEDIVDQKRRMECWGGGVARTKLKSFSPGENQFFTISLFKQLEGDRPRRRKDQFDACFVVVADDVKEKIPETRALQLPEPTYKLRSSQNSEQWGWVLSSPSEDRNAVENLLDGLVEQGLAPNGKDPGMKGVTRYVRLPGGSNTKKKRYVNGKPFKCELISWRPEKEYAIEDLARCFDIDLHAARSNLSGEGVAFDDPLAKNHPIFNYLTPTGIGASNWVNIAECPNAAEHSGGDPTGAAVLITEDGDVAYKCHHGHCEDITGKAVIEMIDARYYNKSGEFTKKCETYAGVNAAIFKEKSEKKGKEILAEKIDESGRFNPLDYVFIGTQNKFYHIKSGSLFNTESFNNRYKWHLPGGKDSDTAASMLFTKTPPKYWDAFELGWKPVTIEGVERENLIFEDSGKKLVNTWRGFAMKPKSGDVGIWLKHAEYLIPDTDQREVVLDFLACVVQRLDSKPAFAIGHRGAHRVGKDLFYKPLMRAMGLNCARAAKIDNLLDDWGDYRRGLKLCIVEEVDKAQDKKVANSMKTLVAPTASGVVTLNLKGGAVMQQQDCMACIMMSNKRHFIAIEDGDSRYFIVDSWVEKREKEYYSAVDEWVMGDGAAFLLDYLLKRDISKFNHNQLPYMTSGAEEMVAKGRYDYEQDLSDLIDDKVYPFNKKFILNSDIQKLREEKRWKCGNNGLQEALSQFGWHKFRGKKKVEGLVENTPWFYTDKLQKDARPAEVWDYFNKNQGGKNVFPLSK